MFIKVHGLTQVEYLRDHRACSLISKCLFLLVMVSFNMVCRLRLLLLFLVGCGAWAPCAMRLATYCRMLFSLT